MHTIQAKSLLSPKNGMNVYRGCTHGCIYCDSRSTCYQMNHDFEDVAVKENAPELLNDILPRKRSKCMIGFGSMSDPYIPAEKTLELTRKCLAIIKRHHFGVSLITKSDLVLRDIDLFKEINTHSKAVISMTLTTADDTLCKKLEPHVAPTSKRVDALSALHDEGIKTIVWLGPILPYINDTDKNLLEILKLCRDANVSGILCYGFGLTLREGNREYYYQKLDELYPGLSKRYAQEFGNKYGVMSPRNKQLMNIFKNFCKNEDIETNHKKLYAMMSEIERDRQTTLF